METNRTPYGIAQILAERAPTAGTLHSLSELTDNYGDVYEGIARNRISSAGTLDRIATKVINGNVKNPIPVLKTVMAHPNLSPETKAKILPKIGELWSRHNSDLNMPSPPAPMEIQ
jgi:hypothetical protein